MTDEKFIIRAYGKSELAMMYLPNHTKETALKLFNTWLKINPRLRLVSKRRQHYYTPKQVRIMVEEFGEPFDIE
jgi:hypothetical protein